MIIAMIVYLEKVVGKLYGDNEVERWYLGLPFVDETATDMTEAIAFPRLSDEEVERYYLGLPLLAA
mgnify:CR=1 FL=1